MSHASAIPAARPVESRPLASTSPEAVSILRAIWVMIAGMGLITVGGIWDFAWHMSIGRDTMWVPPHILVQMGGMLAGIASAYAIATTTFAGAGPGRDASVGILGLHGPAGAFIALWGSVAMVASEPFDNWWHNAYGLDVKMISPPHSLLFLGSFAVKIGTMAWIASIMSRSSGVHLARLKGLFLFVGSLAVTQLSIVIISPTQIQNLHSATCYLVFALFIPPALVATGWAAMHEWGCTIAAAVYSVIMLGSEWILPLIHAQPKLGPVYHNVTHLIPMRFPLLLIVPALLADVLLQQLNKRSSWLKALYLGPAILFSFLAVQWPFATFLLSPAARNWVFGSAYFSYQDPAEILYDPYQFNVVEKNLTMFLSIMVFAFAASILSTRLGLAVGGWMRRVRR